MANVSIELPDELRWKLVFYLEDSLEGKEKQFPPAWKAEIIDKLRNAE